VRADECAVVCQQRVQRCGCRQVSSRCYRPLHLCVPSQVVVISLSLSRQPGRLDAVAAEVTALAGASRPHAALAVPTDITDAASVSSLAEAVAARYESVDVLVNNAGVCCSGPFADTTLDDWCDTPRRRENVAVWRAQRTACGQ
jgi:hypothetical protein